MHLLCRKLSLDTSEPLIDRAQAGDDLVQTLLQDVEDPAEPEDRNGESYEAEYLEHSTPPIGCAERTADNPRAKRVGLIRLLGRANSETNCNTTPFWK
jgi:hypothetical protein